MLKQFTRCAALVAASLLAAGAAADGASRDSGINGAHLDEAVLIERVLEANPGLASRRAALDAAGFRVDPAGSLADPTLSYGIAPGTINSDRFVQQVEFRQPIPWPGTLGAREDVARHEAAAVAGDLGALRLEVIARTRAAYADWRFVAAALAINQAAQTLLDELIVDTETRYAAGTSARQDLLQAEVERAELRKDAFRLRRQWTSVQARINALLNRSPDEPLPPAAALAATPEPPPLERLEALALGRHPELARLDAETEASRSRVALAEKAFFPDLQVGVAYNGQMDDPDKRPVLGVTISVPLDRGRRRAELDGARATERQSRWALVERRTELVAELARVRAEVVEARRSIALYNEELVPLAAEYLAAALSDYRSGAGGFLNVIAAEQRKLAADLGLERARAEYGIRLAELERWVGKPLGNSAEPALSRIEERGHE